MKYIIITPVKDEALYLEAFINSIIKQSILPIEFILVDDSSDDLSAEIIKKFAHQYKWIKYYFHDTRGVPRIGGSKVVEAFNHGFLKITETKWDVISKIDADLELPPDYFERIIKEFKVDSSLGIVGGVIYNKIGTEFQREHASNYHIRGACKSYRSECFFDIGGLRPIWQWDGIDELSALYRGWRLKVVDIPIKHFRVTSSAYEPKAHAYKSGYEAYRMRMSLVLFLVRVLVKIATKPYFLYSCHYIRGYIHASKNKGTFLIDKQFANFINNFHFRRLFGLKR